MTTKATVIRRMPMSHIILRVEEARSKGIRMILGRPFATSKTSWRNFLNTQVNWDAPFQSGKFVNGQSRARVLQKQMINGKYYTLCYFPQRKGVPRPTSITNSYTGYEGVDVS